jgi:putative flippase GtrA
VQPHRRGRGDAGSPRRIAAKRNQPTHPMLTPFFRYALAGAIGTSAHYAVLIGLVQRGGIEPVIASTAGAALGAVVNYLLNHRYTFASRKTHRHALPRFLVIAAAGMVVNAALLAAMHTGLRLHYLVAQILATLAVLGLTYATNRAWTF